MYVIMYWLQLISHYPCIPRFYLEGHECTNCMVDATFKYTYELRYQIVQSHVVFSYVQYLCNFTVRCKAWLPSCAVQIKKPGHQVCGSHLRWSGQEQCLGLLWWVQPSGRGRAVCSVHTDSDHPRLYLDQGAHHRTARQGGELEVMWVSCDHLGIVQSLLLLMLCGCVQLVCIGGCWIYLSFKAERRYLIVKFVLVAELHKVIPIQFVL